eukprot:CAMPEP_0168724650 /NCGR_PEP_ID=MMETSP0724-20121128/3745_1 /TAXON_ID=265536 /ORGANISM="Amphiprora sp., Strain CCMP467" /LENGTH=1224 /DNA_ID=CAMNT_0008771405 /DNA_START=634 /DNA_END=4308 /DNA_ORIENTATION=-
MLKGLKRAFKDKKRSLEDKSLRPLQAQHLDSRELDYARLEAHFEEEEDDSLPAALTKGLTGAQLRELQKANPDILMYPFFCSAAIRDVFDQKTQVTKLAEEYCNDQELDLKQIWELLKGEKKVKFYKPRVIDGMSVKKDMFDNMIFDDITEDGDSVCKALQNMSIGRLTRTSQRKKRKVEMEEPTTLLPPNSAMQVVSEGNILYQEPKNTEASDGATLPDGKQNPSPEHDVSKVTMIPEEESSQAILNSWSSQQNLSSVPQVSPSFLERCTNGFSPSSRLPGCESVRSFLGYDTDASLLFVVKHFDATGKQKELVKALSELHHENLPRFLAFSVKGANIFLVYEFVGHGTLHHLIESKPDHAQFGWENRIEAALSLASALNSMHQIGFAHGNINPSSIYFSNDFSRVVLDEFILGNILESKRQIPTSELGEGQYQAPELANNTQDFHDEKSDVYSFGLIIQLLLTGQLDTAPTPLSISKMTKDARNWWDQECLSRFSSLAKRCLGDQRSRSSRPSFNEILDELVGMSHGIANIATDSERDLVEQVKQKWEGDVQLASGHCSSCARTDDLGIECSNGHFRCCRCFTEHVKINLGCEQIRCMESSCQSAPFSDLQLACTLPPRITLGHFSEKQRLREDPPARSVVGTSPGGDNDNRKNIQGDHGNGIGGGGSGGGGSGGGGGRSGGGSSAGNSSWAGPDRNDEQRRNEAVDVGEDYPYLYVLSQPERAEIGTEKYGLLSRMKRYLGLKMPEVDDPQSYALHFLCAKDFSKIAPHILLKEPESWLGQVAPALYAVVYITNINLDRHYPSWVDDGQTFRRKDFRKFTDIDSHHDLLEREKKEAQNDIEGVNMDEFIPNALNLNPCARRHLTEALDRVDNVWSVITEQMCKIPNASGFKAWVRRKKGTNQTRHDNQIRTPDGKIVNFSKDVQTEPRVPYEPISKLLDCLSQGQSANDCLSQGQFADDDILDKLENDEEILMKWLSTEVARREIESTRKADAPEVTKWMKLISKLYHHLVPLWKRKYHGRFYNDCDVFVSHTGIQKNEYAEPVADYLTENHVVSFIDRRDLKPGCKPSDEMIHAMVTCRHMWCVVTKDFVQNWYPLRELFVGYTRHQQENPDTFCLIMDCLEPGHATGDWIDQILKDMASLQLNTRDGKRQEFPTMLRYLPEENYQKRWRRIASMLLPNGKALVDRKMFPTSHTMLVRSIQQCRRRCSLWEGTCVGYVLV